MKQILRKMQAMRDGEHIITNDLEMDEMTKLDSELMCYVRSIPNPKRLGTLDVYEAWIDPDDYNEYLVPNGFHL